MKERPILFSGPMVRALLDGRKTQTRRAMKPRPPTERDFPHSLFGMCREVADGVKMYSCNDYDRLPKHPTDWHLTGSVGVARDAGFPMRYRCPYGAVGDRLWVKETWRPAKALGPWDLRVTYAADGEERLIQDGEFGERDWTMPKAAARGNVSPLFMPRWASRLTLEITGVRVERLAKISREDAIAEGATSRPSAYGFGSAHDGWSMDWSRVGQKGRHGEPLTERDISLSCPQSAFANFINELHGGPCWNFHYSDASRYPRPIFDENPWVWVVEFRRVDAITAAAA